MAQELKIRVHDYKALEEKIISLGATMTDDASFTDTYFIQPEGEVLKLSESKDSANLIRLGSLDGKFMVLEKSAAMNVPKTLYDLTAEYGVKEVLKGHRKTYTLRDLTLQFNSIGSRGDFLVITGENPTQEFVTDKLGIASPEYITVPFNEVPRQTIL